MRSGHGAPGPGFPVAHLTKTGAERLVSGAVPAVPVSWPAGTPP